MIVDIINLMTNGDMQVSQFNEKGMNLCSSLSVDDIGIRKNTQLVQGGKVVEYPDLGPENPTVDYGGGPTDTPASHIMVFMLTLLNENTKVPCGFFVHGDKLSGKGNFHFETQYPSTYVIFRPSLSGRTLYPEN